MIWIFEQLGVPYAAIRALREPADNVFGNKLAQLRAVRLIELMFESIPQSFFQSFIGLADEVNLKVDKYCIQIV